MEKSNNFLMAIECYQKAFILEPINNQDWFFIHNNLGYSHNVIGRYDEGERYCRIAIRIDPDKHNAYKNLAISLEGQGKYVEAVEYYIKATKVNASDNRALLHLEELLRNQPHLLIDNPDLIQVLDDCKKASQFATEFIRK
ncbi:MAG: tetratricopeptide repeat protein [Anaerolineaceae bacterium]|nr:tetratricopeptide repeat protein [Anaerolineaceae bacterium]